jgi:hypothetical protein
VGHVCVKRERRVVLWLFLENLRSRRRSAPHRTSLRRLAPTRRENTMTVQCVDESAQHALVNTRERDSVKGGGGEEGRCAKERASGVLLHYSCNIEVDPHQCEHVQPKTVDS